VGIDVVTGADVEPFRKKYLVHQDISVGGTWEFYRWRVACKGHAVWSAKVILSPLDFHKFKKWDVLVAMNTSPDFVAIMSMASAIVAEDGGITAHVSVVSRELGIPCVVWISHITSSVKDGEMLEVDANQVICSSLSGDGLESLKKILLKKCNVQWNEKP
jgi:phosphohistidine swiveling domain-containing protein